MFAGRLAAEKALTAVDGGNNPAVSFSDFSAALSAKLSYAQVRGRAVQYWTDPKLTSDWPNREFGANEIFFTVCFSVLANEAALFRLCEVASRDVLSGRYDSQSTRRLPLRVRSC